MCMLHQPYACTKISFSILVNSQRSPLDNSFKAHKMRPGLWEAEEIKSRDQIFGRHSEHMALRQHHMLQCRSTYQCPDISFNDPHHRVHSSKVHYQPKDWSPLRRELSRFQYAKSSIQDLLLTHSRTTGHWANQTSIIKLLAYQVPFLIRCQHSWLWQLLWELFTW